MSLIAPKRMGFSVSPLQKRREPHAFQYLSERASFWIAVLSVLAFVTGNMMGTHGWYLFWKSVFGEYDDSLIVYTGTVAPIALVPDYVEWGLYGGDPSEHTFQQVPRDFLVPLPTYDYSEQQRDYEHSAVGDTYSIAHLGTYKTGAGKGAHTGVDIRVPVGTTVQAIANGLVITVRDEDRGGFGKFVVIRHPRVPDPDDPKRITTLYSVYAHLSAVLVSEGMVVQKGQEIGASGRTGNVTGAHLHFQLERDNPENRHPYWVFTLEEAQAAGLTFDQAIDAGLHRERGLLFTIDPMLYIQANYPAVTLVAGPVPEENTEVTMEVRKSKRARDPATLLARRDQRLRRRAERRRTLEERMVAQKPGGGIIVSQEIVASVEPVPISEQAVASVDIQHDGTFSRGWENIRIVLLDAEGRTARIPRLDRDLVLRTAYGEATFRPESLSALDFQNGEAVVQMLPHGRTTVVIQVQPFGTLSAPMRHVPN